MTVSSQVLAGTPQTWSSSGGTKVLTATSLANGSYRQGVKSATFADATLGMPEYIEWTLSAKWTSAPTNGDTLDLFMGESSNATAATDNPGGLTGADAALSAPAEIINFLRPVAPIPASNSLGTAVQLIHAQYTPSLPFQVPVIGNNGGVALSATGTDFQLTGTPYYRVLI